MIVNKAAIDNLFTALKTTFNNALQAASGNWQETTMKVTSTTKSNDYKWLGTFPRMVKWLGEKTVKSLAAFNYTITNDDFEATVEVDRNDIEDDNLGIYGPQAQMAGHSAGMLPSDLVNELKNASFTTICHDGQFFHDTDHPHTKEGGGVWSNKLTAALSNATLAAADASFGAACLLLETMEDDQGRRLGLVPTILEVPPQLKTIANMLMNNEKLADGTPNPYKGTAKVLVNGGLTSTTAWFLHCTSEPIKPFIYQERKAPVFVSQTSQENDDVFMRKKHKFGAEARAAVGFGLPQLSVGSTGV